MKTLIVTPEQLLALRTALAFVASDTHTLDLITTHVSDEFIRDTDELRGNLLDVQHVLDSAEGV